MTSPAQALSEQFCSGRDFLIARGDQRLAGVPGLTPEGARALCDQVVGSLQPATTLLATGTPAEVIAAAQPLAASRSQTEVVGLGEICLGIGLAAEAPAVSLANAVLLVAAGKAPLAETVGHHLQAGFGSPSDTARAAEWYRMALDAADRGGAPEILPTQALQRNAVIRAALGAPAPAPQEQRLGGSSAPTLPALPRVP